MTILNCRVQELIYKLRISKINSLRIVFFNQPMQLNQIIIKLTESLLLDRHI